MSVTEYVKSLQFALDSLSIRVRDKLTQTLDLQSYQVLHDEVEQALVTFETKLSELPGGEEVPEVDRAEFFSTLSNARKWQIQLLQRLQYLTVVTNNSSSNQVVASHKKHGKLPEVKLTVYKGDFDEWDVFWSSFVANVDSRDDLEDATKFIYLKQSLDGEPKAMVADLSFTDRNYALAVQILKARYADEDRQTDVILQKFYSLPTPKQNPKALRDFMTSYRTFRAQLESLLGVDRAEVLIRSTLVRKVPYQLYREISNLFVTHKFSLRQFDQGMQHLIDTMESAVLAMGEKAVLQQVSTSQSGASNSSSNSQKKSSNQSSNQQRGQRCSYCSESHYSHECSKYKSVNARKDRIKTLKLCFNCLTPGHSSNACRSTRACRHCQQRHHSSLCFKASNNSESASSNSNSKTKTSQGNANGASSSSTNNRAQSKQSPPNKPVVNANSSNSNNNNSSSNKNASNQSSGSKPQSDTFVTSVASDHLPTNILPTATLNLRYCDQSDYVRAFFDTGSHRSFISPEVVRRLNLKVIKQIPINLNTFGNITESCLLDLVKVKVKLGKHKIPITLLVHESASMGQFDCPGLSTLAQSLESKGYHLADHDIASEALSSVEILIGVDHFTRLISRQKRASGTSLFVTRGGGVIPFGPLPKWACSTDNTSFNITNNSVRCARILCESPPEIEISQLWDLERVGICPESYSPSERETISVVRSTIERTDSGYVVQLPFKSETRPSVNYRTARGQLNHLVSKAEQDPNFGQQYDDVVKSYLEREFIEPIPDKPIEGHYMPHHPVFKKSATTPLRIVFNASSKTSEGLSLNDCLLTGPSLTAKLHEILVKFRQGHYAVMADISKAFHRIIVREDDRKYLKFLWVDLLTSEIQTYQFRVVVFGATCSPYLLQETLYTHLSNHVEGIQFVDKFYVDNYMNTYDSEASLMEDKIKLETILDEASMPLQEWISNNSNFNQFYNLAVPDTQNVLGLTWETQTDNINVSVGEKLSYPEAWKFTKRQILSLVSSIFDPLGWVSPVTVRGKIFLQTLWKLKLSWDEKVSDELVQLIKPILIDFQTIDQIAFPRHVLHNNCELHVFVDASSKALGAAAYAVSLENRSSNLVVSKVRVAPCREGRLTIPKLELTSLLIGARLIHYLTGLHSFSSIFLWTDSKVTISWVTSDKDIKDVYVANRVAEAQTLIQKHSISVMYVPTKENPADHLSRGCTVQQLQTSNWKHGPSWLLTRDLPDQSSNLVSVNELTVELNPVQPTPPLIDLSRFSSLNKVRRVMSVILKFVQSPASPFEKLVRQEQLLHCPSIHAYLTNPRTNVTLDVKTTIKQLNLYLENGVIRSKGRINNAELPLDSTTPLFLPNKSHLVELLILHLHSSHLHSGLSQTLTLYRQMCWTPKIRTRVKSLLLRCVICQRVKKATCHKPLPPQLPPERTKWVRPFHAVGVDHTGSFRVKTNGDTSKAYICLFVCTVTRAVHLEVVDNLSTQSFINCLRRLAAAKGAPSVILSDNHRTFVSGEKFLLELQQSPEVQQYLKSTTITWRHQTPRSPWMGGHFERLIRVVKSCLSTSISRKLLTIEEFTTVIKEVENIVNGRPLTYQSAQSNDVPLTPAQLAWGRDLPLMPSLLQPGDPFEEDLDTRETRNQYVLISNALERFRYRWNHEYLSSLREKHNNCCAENPTHHLAVGQLVMVKHENLRRIEWPLGVIKQLYPDPLGVIRTAEVQEGGKRYQRSITHLVPLELDCPTTGNECQAQAEEDDDIVAENFNQLNIGGVVPDDESLTSDLPEPDHSASGSPDEDVPVGTTSGAAEASLTSPSIPLPDDEGTAEGERLPSTRPPRRAALQQRQRLRQLIDDDLI